MAFEYQDILTEVQALWDESSTLYELWEQRWAQNEKLVNSQHLTARKAGQSSLFIPKIESYHQRKMADHLFAFGGEDAVSLRRTLTSSKHGASIMEKVVNYYLTDAGGINWSAVVVNGASNALTYNFAPAVVGWDRGVAYDSQEIENVDEEGNTVIEVVEVERETHSNPTIRVIPPEDFRIDPAVGWDELHMARYGSMREWFDKAYAMQMTKQGLWPEIPENYFDSSTLNTYAGSLGSERAFQGQEFFTPNTDNGLIEVRTYWYYKDLGDGYVPVQCVTLEDKMVLEEPEELEIDFSNADGTDPFPFVVGRIYVKPHEPVSRAMPEKLQQLNVEVNAIRNQRRDNVALALNPEKLISTDSGVDPATFSRSFAGKVITTNNINAVRWERAPDVTASSYNEEQISTNDMEKLIAESAQRLGGETQRKETATQAKLTASNAQAAAGFDSMIFGMSYINPLIRKLIRAIRQAADPQIFFMAADDLNLQDKVEDPFDEAVSGEFRMNVSANVAQVVKDTAISNASNLSAMIASTYGPNANYYPIFADALEMNGYNPDDIIPPPQQQMTPENPAFQDLGGVEGTGNLQVQPNVQKQGGAFNGGA